MSQEALSSSSLETLQQIVLSFTHVSVKYSVCVCVWVCVCVCVCVCSRLNGGCDGVVFSADVLSDQLPWKKKTLSRLSSSSSEVWKPAGDNLLFFLFFLSLPHPLPIFPSVLLHPLNYFFFSLPAHIRHKFRLTSLVAVKSVIFLFCRLLLSAQGGSLFPPRSGPPLLWLLQIFSSSVIYLFSIFFPGESIFLLLLCMQRMNNSWWGFPSLFLPRGKATGAKRLIGSQQLTFPRQIKHSPPISGGWSNMARWGAGERRLHSEDSAHSGGLSSDLLSQMP